MAYFGREILWPRAERNLASHSRPLACCLCHPHTSNNSVASCGSSGAAEQSAVEDGNCRTAAAVDEAVALEVERAAAEQPIAAIVAAAPSAAMEECSTMEDDSFRPAVAAVDREVEEAATRLQQLTLSLLCVGGVRNQSFPVKLPANS